MEANTSDTAMAEGTAANSREIPAAINNMKAEFSSKFDIILSAVENVRKEISNCSEQLTQAEMWISTTEDYVNTLQEKV